LSHILDVTNERSLSLMALIFYMVTTKDIHLKTGTQQHPITDQIDCVRYYILKHAWKFFFCFLTEMPYPWISEAMHFRVFTSPQ